MKKTIIVLLFFVCNVNAQIRWNETEKNHLGMFINPTFDDKNIQIGFNYAWYYESGQFAEVSISAIPYSNYYDAVLSYGGVLEYNRFDFLFGGRLGFTYRGTERELDYFNNPDEYIYKFHILGGVFARLDYQIYEELHLGLQFTTDFDGYEQNNPIRYNLEIVLSFKY